MQIEYAKVSALGDRSDNQDRAAVVVAEEAALMLVFDGMGGHSDGARAAETGLKIIEIAVIYGADFPRKCAGIRFAGLPCKACHTV